MKLSTIQMIYKNYKYLKTNRIIKKNKRIIHRWLLKTLFYLKLPQHLLVRICGIATLNISYLLL